MIYFLKKMKQFHLHILGRGNPIKVILQNEIKYTTIIVRVSLNQDNLGNIVTFFTSPLRFHQLSVAHF